MDRLMKKITGFALVAVLMLCGNIVYAEIDDKKACYDMVSTVETVDCIDNVRKLWDKRLNERYKALMKACENKECKKQLKDMQLAWIKYRDLVVKYKSDPFADGASGSASSFNSADFVLDATRSQAIILGYGCTEGDLSCTPPYTDSEE